MQNHPLFPPLNDDEEAPEVTAIHVSRFENGGTPWCPYKFAPEELTELQQIYDLFGGGKYELVARGEVGFSARRRYEIPGRPKPLTGPAGAEELPEVPRVATVAAAPPTTDAGLLGLMLQMMTTQAQSNQQMMMAMMQNSTAMMTAMVNRDAESSKTLLQAMSQNNERALQGQAQVFQAMIEATGKGGSGKDLLAAYRDGLGDAAGSETDKSEGEGDILTTVSQVAEAVKLASVFGGGSNTAPEVPQ